jgi:hypothetical protein
MFISHTHTLIYRSERFQGRSVYGFGIDSLAKRVCIRADWKVHIVYGGGFSHLQPENMKDLGSVAADRCRSFLVCLPLIIILLDMLGT